MKEIIKQQKSTLPRFLDNAQILSDLSELPKIGDSRKYYDNSKCISVAAYEDEKHEDYLFYRVEYLQGNHFFDLGDNCFHFSYCIKKSYITKG